MLGSAAAGEPGPERTTKGPPGELARPGQPGTPETGSGEELTAGCVCLGLRVDDGCGQAGRVASFKRTLGPARRLAVLVCSHRLFFCEGSRVRLQFVVHLTVS